MYFALYTVYNNLLFSLSEQLLFYLFQRSWKCSTVWYIGSAAWRAEKSAIPVSSVYHANVDSIFVVVLQNFGTSYIVHA